MVLWFPRLEGACHCVRRREWIAATCTRHVFCCAPGSQRARGLAMAMAMAMAETCESDCGRKLIKAEQIRPGPKGSIWQSAEARPDHHRRQWQGHLQRTQNATLRKHAREV
jgi:hypothetical protein